MHRLELQKLASLRLKDARVLIAGKQWSGAYYLSGYALECGLKACVVQNFKKSTLPSKKFVSDAYTHDLNSLVKLAGLTNALDQNSRANTQFELNWTVAKDWSEQARYATWTQSEAEELYRAINSRTYGVLQWLKGYW